MNFSSSDTSTHSEAFSDLQNHFGGFRKRADFSSVDNERKERIKLRKSSNTGFLKQYLFHTVTNDIIHIVISDEWLFSVEKYCYRNKFVYHQNSVGKHNFT